MKLMIVESGERGAGPVAWLTVLQTIAANRPDLFGRREVSWKAPVGYPVYFSLDWEELSVDFVPGPAGVGGALIKTRSERADRALVEAATRWGFQVEAGMALDRTPGVGLDKEPPAGRVVSDRDGDRWRHVDGGWLPVNAGGPGKRLPWTWAKLNETHGPLFRSK